MSGIYRCKHCHKSVDDRHPYLNEYCEYSPTDRHDWSRDSEGFANDTKWNESFVGKYWKWLLIAGIIAYFLHKFGIL